mmetsp:Transcript_34626/g.89805  ORF Transcript_34626/g.89805 Transcript_34626/m.89805 type:complete len:104 (+) Transcript_34626:2181-2492(+)
MKVMWAIVYYHSITILLTTPAQRRTYLPCFSFHFHFQFCYSPSLFWTSRGGYQRVLPSSGRLQHVWKSLTIHPRSDYVVSAWMDVRPAGVNEFFSAVICTDKK